MAQDVQRNLRFAPSRSIGLHCMSQATTAKPASLRIVPHRPHTYSYPYHVDRNHPIARGSSLAVAKKRILGTHAPSSAGEVGVTWTASGRRGISAALTKAPSLPPSTAYVDHSLDWKAWYPCKIFRDELTTHEGSSEEIWERRVNARFFPHRSRHHDTPSRTYF